jgi:hypothetical protein
MTFDQLATDFVRSTASATREKHPPNFHSRSEPVLHFHNGPGRTCADVRFGGDFQPVTPATPKQREVLLEQVKAHVTGACVPTTEARIGAKKTLRRLHVSVRLLRGMWLGCPHLMIT